MYNRELDLIFLTQMIKRLIPLIFICLTLSCVPKKEEQINLIDLVPHNTSLVAQINDGESLKTSTVVSKFVAIKKRGKEFVGLSPFKNEKTPSFTINDEKGFYHCFSTGEHGNIFDFLMKTKSLGYGEAVKTLAAEAGMQPYSCLLYTSPSPRDS